MKNAVTFVVLYASFALAFGFLSWAAENEWQPSLVNALFFLIVFWHLPWTWRTLRADLLKFANADVHPVRRAVSLLGVGASAVLGLAGALILYIALRKVNAESATTALVGAGLSTFGVLGGWLSVRFRLAGRERPNQQ